MPVFDGFSYKVLLRVVGILQLEQDKLKCKKAVGDDALPTQIHMQTFPGVVAVHGVQERL